MCIVVMGFIDIPGGAVQNKSYCCFVLMNFELTNNTSLKEWYTLKSTTNTALLVAVGTKCLQSIDSATM